jgi:RNA polymerase sigma factor (sigma-70 family)
MGVNMGETEFRDFFALMYPKLVKFGMRKVDFHTAQDLAAATLETLWKKEPEAPSTDLERAQLHSFAFRIFDGHLRNTLRGNGRHVGLLKRLISLDVVARDEPDGSTAINFDYPPWFDQLSERDQEVLKLFNDGYRTAEIAEILGCSPGTASKRLNRAKERIQEILKQKEEDE